MTKSKKQMSAKGSNRRQRGVSLIELLLITTPLCVLSMALASAISATSTAKNTSMWKASLKAQQATTQPCGGIPYYFLPRTFPASSDKQDQFNQGRSKAAEIGIIGMDITMTGTKTESVTEQVPKFHFENAAGKMFPERSKEAENSATFTCNEPDNGNSRRAVKEAILTGRAFLKSQELY